MRHLLMPGLTPKKEKSATSKRAMVQSISSQLTGPGDHGLRGDDGCCKDNHGDNGPVRNHGVERMVSNLRIILCVL